MMRAAVRLCRDIGYRSAGTVEYMYRPSDGKYFFLELNPRLQVEHPVTEGITGVSLPATQLHVAMGIPLYNIPEVRTFYDEDPGTVGEFDLEQFKPQSQYPKHLVAARITAENPDEGFKPTSGKIDRINFQSDTKVWGYFSVVADGGVHEFADSQFGHIFATGDTREEARKALVLALKELFIMGDIRTTVEYLGELLETEEFKQNTIDTAWLDGLIAAKSVSVEVDPEAAVINAAVYRGYTQVQDAIESFKGALEKGQLSTLPLRELQSLPVEITYQDVKYQFTVEPKAPDAFMLKINSQQVLVRTRKQADGSLYVAYGAETHQLYAKEEPLGLRMVLDGVTVLLPTVYDPSEMRSDITGKLVRYLVEDGAEVKAGDPYAEAEAMKMLITIKAEAEGTVKHELQPGSIINQGDLLASLALKDPSKTKKIETYTGELTFTRETAGEESTLAGFRSAQKSLELVMDGYSMEAEPLVQKLLAALSSIDLVLGEVQDAAAALGNKLPVELDAQLQAAYAKAVADHVTGEDTKEVAALIPALTSTIDAYIEGLYENKREGMVATLAPVVAVLDKYSAGLREHAISVVCALLQRFMAVETSFAGISADQALSALIKAAPDDFEAPYAAAFAHEQLPLRSSLAISLLRQLFTFPERFGVEPLRELPPALGVVSQISQLPGASYKDVALTAAQFGLFKAEKPFSEIVEELRAELVELGPEGTAMSRSLAGNALLELFPDPEVGETAMQMMIKRLYRTWDLLSVTTSKSGGLTKTEFTYKSADKLQGDAEPPVRNGLLAVGSELDSLAAALPELLESYAGSGSIHFALTSGIGAGAGAEENLIAAAATMLQANKDALQAKGVRDVTVMVPNSPKWPRTFHFDGSLDFAEVPFMRNLRPTMLDLLELDRLKNWAPERLPTIGHNTAVLIGQQGVKPRVQQRLFVRGLTHSDAASQPAAAEASLLKALDELQLAFLEKKVSPTASAHLFLHILPTVEAEPEQAIALFDQVMSGLISKHATRLLKLSVDEIEVRVHCQGANGRQAVRLMASSMSGQWLKTDGYLEYVDPTTGVPTSYCSVGEDEMCFLEPYPVSSTLSNKRAIARRIGTTYAYDFLGLLEKGIVKMWQAAIADGTANAMPSNLLEAEELLLKTDGSLVRGERLVGSNDIGMIGFHTTLKTPEYPEGRPLVIVANDCTVMSGSFGVDEDEFFDKVSKYARAGGLPRLHIASNSGARIGLAEEFKPYFKVAWNDEANVGNGFKYLYLSEEDTAKFAEGTFHGEWVVESGEKRFKLDDIVGEKDGLGVENLRGSGLIAGETSAAYEETFTLSYVTGRSVGIGAYINRLAQRVIQMANGPIILTGFSALNKLLGKEVYTSQDQLGGPQIMMPNGVSHQLAQDDQDGVEKILRWLSYVPKTADAPVAIAPSADPIDRSIGFVPTSTPYDPRHMLGGTTAPDGSWVSGFFDQGSFEEYLAEWGKSVVIGRARLGGVPMGVIAVETRLSEQRIPADPANPNSRETVLAQAGQVWFPDSAFKTAQAIKDFNQAENLPLMIFANWRGFSGGTRDMFGEILKFGSYIVDNLRDYKQPVFSYIPPCGELRGGAWVVIDPTINEDMMEMYADTNARGGILEPPGICEIKFRKPDLLKSMHRLDPKLQQLTADLAIVDDSLGSEAEADDLRKQIAARETTLMPLYTQISHEFADLHDRPGRMRAKGTIRDVVDWGSAREYFAYRVRRRLVQDGLVKELRAADGSLSHTECLALLQSWVGGAWEDDKEAMAYFEDNADAISEKIGDVRTAAVKKQVSDLLSGLPEGVSAEFINSLL